ncbi:MAG: ATP-binding protein [Acholeplasmatales bacterium]|jgi:primosomal protein DnaI|nr:ATP-binding protein [Acholeplasmatales bacterium]
MTKKTTVKPIEDPNNLENQPSDILNRYEDMLKNPHLIPKGFQPQLVYKDQQLIDVTLVSIDSDDDGLAKKIETFDSYGLYEQANYKTLKTTTANQKNIFKAGLDFIADFKKQRKAKGFYLRGKFRTGKTYFLSALAKELVKVGSVGFFYVADLMRIMHSSMNDGSLEERIKYLKTVDALFLDDLGSTSLSSWFRDSCLTPIINSRLILNKATFISTNHNNADLMGILSNSDTDSKLVSGLIYRLQEITVFLSLNDQLTE